MKILLLVGLVFLSGCGVSGAGVEYAMATCEAHGGLSFMWGGTRTDSHVEFRCKDNTYFGVENFGANK